MPIPLWIAIAAVVSSAIAGFVTWRVAARKSSGGIDFTEAEVLWGELRAELVNLREREQRQETRIEHLEEALELARKESISARVESAAARAESKQLRIELAAFTKVANGVGDG